MNDAWRQAKCSVNDLRKAGIDGVQAWLGDNKRERDERERDKSVFDVQKKV